MIAYTVREVPKWNPINVCSYHLQEAGATPVQEIAYALATAIGVLDAVRDSGKVDPSEIPAVVGRISFFVNAGIRFVEETCKMRALTRMWDRICLDRYGVEDPKLRRFRYGVQVNSLGLTEAQPENNVPRIVLEALGVTLSRKARARAMQLPAWNEALGLPRPWDQQWSLRIQQILAYRDRPARVRGHLRGLHRDRGEDRRAGRGGRRGARGRARDGRGLRSSRRAQAPTGAQPGRAGAAHRNRRAPRGRGQLLHRDRAVAARDGRRRSLHHLEGGPRRRGAAARRRGGVACPARQRGGGGRARRIAARGGRRGHQPHAGHDRARARGRHHRRMGRARCARSSASTGLPPA